MAPIFYWPKLQRFTATALALAMALVALTSCAAMRRTWQFQGQSASAPALQVEVQSADVSQRHLGLQLRLRNPGAQPIAVQCENAAVTLPDGQTFTTSVGGLHSDWQRGLAAVGIGKRPGTLTIAAGETAALEISLTQGQRDLRRVGVLQVRLSDLQVDGQPVELPPVLLRAPPEAPLGEDI